MTATQDEGGGVAEPANASASPASNAATPSGPSTTRSASAARSGTSAEPLHTSSPGVPLPRNWRTAANAGLSPRSSPQNRIEDGSRSAASSVIAAPLSDPGGR